MAFKDRVKNRRIALNMTMNELAALVGVSAPTIQRYESGEIQNIRRDKIKLLADALKTTPGYLMGWEDSVSSTGNENTDETSITDLPEEIQILNRAAKKMSPEKRQRLLDMAKLMFEEDFSDDE